MSAAIAMAPSPAPHERSSLTADVPASNPSMSAPNSSPAKKATASASATTTTTPAQRPRSNSPKNAAQKSSPSNLARTAAANTPQIVIKKEPASPTNRAEPQSRHRPRKLDLSRGTLPNGPQTARPATTRDGLGIQEVGIACLSPGFATQDPTMKEQLQRSISVREQQRQIIESRLHSQQSAKGGVPGSAAGDNGFAARTPGMSRRNKGPPPGLSIVAPSHEQFAHERVIQSAPLGHSFTGRNAPMPPHRQVANQATNLSSTSHIHHVPATQTANRLPPIHDVFGQGLQTSHPESSQAQLYPNHNSSRAPMASPGLPPPPPPQAQQQQQSQAPTSGRPREYKSAEEAQQELAGGRPELLPKLVHYGGHQPPTPPSPAPGSRQGPVDPSRSASKRRTRAEYEDGASPPLGHGPATSRRTGPFGAGRDSPETQRAKREEFLGLCARAWDLFHS